MEPRPSTFRGLRRIRKFDSEKIGSGNEHPRKLFTEKFGLDLAILVN